MAKEDLIPMNKRSKEEVKEIARRGGINSGITRRKKKAMKEQAELLLSLKLIDEKSKKKMREMGIDEDNLDNQMALMVSCLKKGITTGDKSILEFFRDTTEGKLKEKVEVSKVDDTIKELNDYLCDKKN
jgi:hypothetical protein